MITVNHYLLLSAILFSIGTFGVLVRKNAIVIFMCIEVMLNSVNLTFIALSRHVGNMDGQIFVLFFIKDAASEEAGVPAFMIAFFRNKESIEVDDFNMLKW